MFCTVLSMQSCTDEGEDGPSDCPIGYTGIDCETLDSLAIQTLLDEGKTPLELMNDGVPLSGLYGKMYEGGLIFYLNENDGSGMVAATEDQSEGARWGCLGDEIDGADGEAVGTGAQNTLDILMGCTTSGTTTKICNDLELNGYSDWFLPSKGELRLMWKNLADSDGDGYSSGAEHEGNIGNFAASFYASSTEYSTTSLWVQFFSSGLQLNDFKTGFHHVRAVRAF
ncbi:MAG: hypothetical protein ACPG5B_10800 [Chitinophagales bacterium]